MEPISTILTSALGYIFKAASQTKTAKTAENEMVGRFWKWIKPHVIKDVPKIETKYDKPKTQAKTQKRLVELVKNEGFFEELSGHVEELKKAGIKEKNIVEADFKNVKTIVIGDKTYSPDEVYDRKNVFKGKVEGSDSFIIGDGH